MRKYTITSAILCLLWGLPSYGQIIPEYSPYCISSFLNHQLQSQYPTYYSAVESFYHRALDQLDQTTELRNEAEQYVIPVIVHVVYKTETENISTQRIHQQLAVLNEDFQKNNADTILVRPEFAESMGNPNISFELIDIIRVKTDTIFELGFDWNTLRFQYPDYVKQSAFGGSDPRDVDTYLNIWVCPIQSDQFFGYAYPPDGLKEWPEEFTAPNKNFDGIVINYKTFGRHLSPFIDLEGNLITLNGRTTTHEVGHYLGLRHPWGDGDLEMPGCQIDDGLSDTPNAALPASFNCDHQQNTCEDGSFDLPDMIENFMDYSADDCKNGFTHQQSELMRYVLRTHRNILRIKKVPIAHRDEVLVYPNPSSGDVTVFVNPKVNLTYEISVRNINGQKLNIPIQANLYNRNDHYRFDLSQEAMGVYTIEFATNGIRAFTKRIVLVR